VNTGPEDRLALIRRYYEAYDNSDRSLIESALHARFSFSSPNDDDNIDQAAYFARCWPNHEAIRRFTLLDVCADGDSALVRYHASTLDGAGFSNVERFEFREDLIAHVDCYFGPPVPGQTTSNWGAKSA
jgi:SnoaL-like domain